MCVCMCVCVCVCALFLRSDFVARRPLSDTVSWYIVNQTLALPYVNLFSICTHSKYLNFSKTWPYPHEILPQIISWITDHCPIQVFSMLYNKPLPFHAYTYFQSTGFASIKILSKCDLTLVKWLVRATVEGPKLGQCLKSFWMATRNLYLVWLITSSFSSPTQSNVCK